MPTGRRVTPKPRASLDGLSLLAQRLGSLPVLAVRDTARAAYDSLVQPRLGVRGNALRSAIDWLCMTHEVTGRRGSSKGFSLLFGWLPAFPETTGYVIGTLLAYSRLTSEDRYARHAREMGDWELEVQYADGGIMQGLLDGRGRPPEVFNTGMVMHGWLDLSLAEGGREYIAAAERAGRFVLRTQDADGAWRGEHSYLGIPHTYMSRVSWALLRLARLSGEQAYEAAARKNLDWVVSMQRDNGWFEACAFKPGALPNTHGIAYTLRGLLESHALLDHEPYLKSVMRASEVLIRKLEVLGTLPATFDSSWEPTARYVCLTGLVQLGGVWLRLYEVTGDARFLNAGLKAVDLAAAHQERRSRPPLQGALPGSFPIFGRYAPLQCPNWATKFLADGLMLRDECLPAA